MPDGFSEEGEADTETEAGTDEDVEESSPEEI